MEAKEAADYFVRELSKVSSEAEEMYKQALVVIAHAEAEIELIRKARKALFEDRVDFIPIFAKLDFLSWFHKKPEEIEKELEERLEAARIQRERGLRSKSKAKKIMSAYVDMRNTLWALGFKHGYDFFDLIYPYLISTDAETDMLAREEES